MNMVQEYGLGWQLDLWPRVVIGWWVGVRGQWILVSTWGARVRGNGLRIEGIAYLAGPQRLNTTLIAWEVGPEA